MVKFVRNLLLVSICTGFIASACVAEVSESAVNHLLKASGIAKQLSEFPGMVKAGLDLARQQSPQQIPEELYDAMISTMKRSFDPVIIMDDIGTALKNTVNEEEIKLVTEWMQSDLGKKIKEQENKASTPDALQTIIKESQSLLSDKERVAFAQRIDKLTKASDMAINIQEYTGVAIYSAIISVLHPKQPLNINDVKERISPQLSQTRANVEQLVIAFLVYAYKKIDLADLKAYEAVLNTPQSITLNKKVNEGMTTAMENCISKWAYSLADIVKEKKKK